MNYIFLDEIQHGPNFEKVYDSLFIKDNADVYITGSNAYFMLVELNPLQRIHDNYPKYLLTLDYINSNADYDGIKKINDLKWLLNQ